MFYLLSAALLALALSAIAIPFVLGRALASSRRKHRRQLRQQGGALQKALEVAGATEIGERDGSARGRLPAERADLMMSLDVIDSENESYVDQGRGPIQVTTRMRVDVLGLTVPFRLRPWAMVPLSGLGEKIGLLDDTKVGDAAFDDWWIVEADGDLARAALPGSIRERLARLAHVLPGLTSVELGPDGLTVEWRGLTLEDGSEPRWTPPEDPAGTVAYVGETLLALRSKILGHVESRSLAGSSEGVYREVRVGTEPEPVRVEIEPEATAQCEVDQRGKTSTRS